MGVGGCCPSRAEDHIPEALTKLDRELALRLVLAYRIWHPPGLPGLEDQHSSTVATGPPHLSQALFGC
jgi:hypothetical protein